MTHAAAPVLLVDDHLPNLLALEAVLDDPGWELVRARSGREALARLAERDFAAVLLDLRLPDLDGFAVARRIRAEGRAPGTPVLFLTAADGPDFPVTEAYRLGAVDYLVKPLAPDILRAKVAVFVDLFRKAERVRELEREAAERRAGERLRALGDNIPAGFVYQIVAGPEGARRFTYVSAGIDRLFGVPPAAVLADAGVMYGLILPEDRDRVAAAEEAAAAVGGPFDCEFRVRTRAGDVRWVHCRSAPRAERGQEVWDGLLTDVTARKAAEERLARDAQLLANVSDAVIVTDPDGVVTYWNAGAERLFGWAAAEVVGRPYADRFPEPVRDWVAAQIRGRVAGEEWDGEYEDYRRDGSRVWIDAHVRRMTDPAGRVTGVIGVSRDATARRELEAALRARAEGLAEEARRRDEFLAVLAHELRNPLAPLRNGLHLLEILDAEMPPAARPVRAMMARQIGHLVRLVDDLLDVSRISRGKVELRREVLDLRTVARQAVETSHPLVEAGRHRLEVDLPDAPVWVDGDPTRLTQVVANLLNNAAKYTPDGGRIRLTLTPDPDKGGVAVRVADNGIGIQPDVLRRVFDPFAQGERGRDRAQGGLGIGLALVRRLVELHGGSVEAHSAGPGRGSEFVVHLPAAPAPPAG